MFASITKTLKFLKSVCVLFLCISVGMLLVGCSNKEKQEIKNLKDKLKTLETEKAILQKQYDGLFGAGNSNVHKVGNYVCDDMAGGWDTIRFVSNNVVHIVGVAEYDAPLFDNYYLYKFVDQDTLELVDDIDVPGALEFYTYEKIKDGIHVLEGIKFSNEGMTITVSPYGLQGNCTYQADN